jgi:hypothetical protein
MIPNLQDGMSRELGITVFVAFVVGAFVAYRLLVLLTRRRRIVAVELRLEAAWQNFKVTMGIRDSRKSVGLAGPFLGGLQMGLQGRVLGMRPLAAMAAKKPGSAPLPLAEAAAAGAEPAAGAPVGIETVQQTQISCDI